MMKFPVHWANIHHQDDIHCLFFDVHSGESIYSQYLHNQTMRVILIVVGKFCHLIQIHQSFFLLNSFKHKSMIIGSVEELPTFSTVGVGTFLHVRNIVPEIKRLYEIFALLFNQSCEYFRSINFYLIGKCS